MAQYFISKDCLGKYFSFYLATNEPEILQYVHVTSTFWPFEKNYNWHKVKKKNPEKYSATNNSQKQMELSLELHNQVEPFFFFGLQKLFYSIAGLCSSLFAHFNFMMQAQRRHKSKWKWLFCGHSPDSTCLWEECGWWTISISLYLRDFFFFCESI